MANMTFGEDKVGVTPWTVSRRLDIGNETLGSSTTYYAGQAGGRNTAGLFVQMDDTAKAEFIGIVENLTRPTVDSSAARGDFLFQVLQPLMISAKIASAVVGDEGRSVFWKFNNEVSYTPGASHNKAGKVWKVGPGGTGTDSTHVTVTPPWMRSQFDGPFQGMATIAGTGTVTLTKFDANWTFTTNTSGNVQINLPVSTQLSPGDTIEILKTSSGANSITMAVQGSDSVNGATTTFAATATTTQFGVTRAITDGAGNWYAKTY